MVAVFVICISLFFSIFDIRPTAQIMTKKDLITGDFLKYRLSSIVTD